MNWVDLFAQSLPTAFGTSFALLLGTVTWLYRKNRERKEVLSRALYNLLIVWQAISKSVRLDLEEFQRILFEEIIRRSDLPEDTTADEAMRELESHEQYDPQVFEEMARKSKRLAAPGGLKRFSERLEETIRTLSETEPLLAYSLTRDYDIDRLLANIQNVIEATGETFEIDELDSSQYQRLIEDLLTDRMLSGIEKDIARLAWKIGPIVWIRTRWKVWHTSKKHNRIDPERVRKYLDTVETYVQTWVQEK
jgi:hypothetical protein